MRKVATSLKQTHAHLKEALIVYDMFSDRLGCKRGTGEFQLRGGEATLVTCNEAIDSVLGGWSARKRQKVSL